MITLLIIIWLLFGILSIFFLFNSMRKEWYDTFHKEYWNCENETALHFLLYFSFIPILGGILSFTLSLLFTPKRYWSIWFKLPKN